MNGFLAYDGIFYECEYSEHCNLAEELSQKYKLSRMDKNFNLLLGDDKVIKNRFIYFGATPNLGNNTDSYVFADNKDVVLTQEQLAWYKDNNHKLTNKQIKDFEKIKKWAGVNDEI